MSKIDQYEKDVEEVLKHSTELIRRLNKMPFDKVAISFGVTQIQKDRAEKKVKELEKFNERLCKQVSNFMSQESEWENEVEILKDNHKKLMEIAMGLAEDLENELEAFSPERFDIPATASIVELSKYRTEIKELESE